MLNIFMLDNFFRKALFNEETAKNWSEYAFDHFLGKRGFLDKKINITFFITN